MVTLTNPGSLSDETREELVHLVTALQLAPVTDMGGFDADETETFLRQDGTWASAGLTQAQVLARASLRG